MIFVVEDDDVLRRTLHEYLATPARPVESFRDAEAALEAVHQRAPELIVSDIHLPGMDGLALLRRVGDLAPGTIRIAMTAHSSLALASEAVRQGCYEYLEKPVDLERLERMIDRVLDDQRAARELAWIRSQSAAMVIGASPAMQHVRSQIEMLARARSTPPPVLITGETGVGKGLVARAIHDAAAPDAPWISVNCAALPDSLVESELFGHEKAAFTDAKAGRPGLFEAAHRGTIFLDEIGALPLAAQAKLLHVVESGTVRRLGGTQERVIDARIVAATNEDLVQAVREGRFRQDLLHRLSAVPLEIPPLRVRGDDAVLLAQAFLEECAQKYRKRLVVLAPGVMDRIARHPWPGNVRELRFAIERAVLQADPEDEELCVDVVQGPPSGDVVFPATPPTLVADRLILQLPAAGVPFDDIEREALSQALAACEGNVTRAAAYLSLSADQARYRIRRLGLEPRTFKPAKSAAS